MLQSQNGLLSRYDRDLAKTVASQQGLTKEQVFYINFIGHQLKAYIVGATNSMAYYQVTGIIVVASPFISAAITGTDYIRCDTAKSLSFGLNITAALMLAVTQFLSLDKNAAVSLQTAAKFRWELLQYAGASSTYKNLTPEERYQEFADSTDGLIKDSINNLSKSPFPDLKIKSDTETIQRTPTIPPKNVE